MAADNPPASTESTGDTSPEAAAAAAAVWPPQNLRNLWQVPAIVVSAILIGLALRVVSDRAPANDFDGVLDETRGLIVGGHLDDAADRLENILLPNLSLARPGHVARFHALAADWLFASQRAQGVSLDEWNERIVTDYSRAEENGLALDVPRRLRIGHTLLDLGRIEEARGQLAALDALTGNPDSRLAAEQAHNELMRRIVEDSLAAPATHDAFAASRNREVFERNMALLADFRANPALEPADEAWTVARQAELRLREGDFDQAIDRLQIDMRRLERRFDREAIPGGSETWGELYTLLGRAYVERGDAERGEYYLDQAMARFEPDAPGRRDTLLYLAIVNASRHEHDEVLRRLDEVVGGGMLDHTDEPWYLPALLLRAETLNLIGSHEESLDNYARLVELMRGQRTAGRLRPERVADSLVDRLESAIMHDDLELGLEYATRAEPLFDRARVPAPLLERIAATNRQIADNVMAGARLDLGDYSHRTDLVDPSVRATANARYRRAGEYFRRHAQAVGLAAETEDDVQSASYYRAGDSFDLAGDLDAAVEAFALIPGSDLRWTEAQHRLGVAYQARGYGDDFERAAETFGRLIEMHPASSYATRSLVPYARCLIELGQIGLAREKLLSIVEGRSGESEDGRDVLEPEAPDYLAALLALGAIYHDEGDYVKAIEYLDTAVTRLVGSSAALNEARYRLADAHRLAGEAEQDLLEHGPRLSPSERAAAEDRRRVHLEKAMDLYGLVVDGYGQFDPRVLDPLQHDFERNAAMARADSAYDLGDYQLALSRYDEAARRYHDHYASMHAMVQIVNCYMNLSDVSRARVAHDKAMRHLEQLSDNAFDDPRSIMDRTAWEEWLRNMPVASVASGGISP